MKLMKEICSIRVILMVTLMVIASCTLVFTSFSLCLSHYLFIFLSINLTYLSIFINKLIKGVS
ncbi:hypothetical protein WN944_009249 [Citrus x changshan-huyou]|uniref:Uncharacterized protein n=1 Tax=Citrus x changshan-huyou TaxID=2935761 RepID=A0AAP0QRX5_9ROSI